MPCRLLTWNGQRWIHHGFPVETQQTYSEKKKNNVFKINNSSDFNCFSSQQNSAQNMDKIEEFGVNNNVLIFC